MLSKISQSQKAILYDSMYEIFKVVQFIKTESRIWLPGAGER